MTDPKAPKRIIAMATREGTFWKEVQPDPWFGEAFDAVEYVRADVYQASADTIEQLRAREKLLRKYDSRDVSSCLCMVDEHGEITSECAHHKHQSERIAELEAETERLRAITERDPLLNWKWR